MTDSAHVATDKELAKMERHLAKIYGRASKELQEKADAYFGQFEKLDKRKRALVESGKITEKEYQNWRRTQMMQYQHFTKMKEEAAKSLANANQIATDYINGRLPKIYSENYNYQALATEKTTKKAVSFELASEGSIRELALSKDKSLLPKKILDPAKDIPWNMKNINSEVLQGIIQGETITEIAKRVSNVGSINEVSAVRAARTIVTTVENKARFDCATAGEKKGIVYKKIWLAVDDNRTRDAHREAGKNYGTEEKAIPKDEPFIVDGEEMMHPGDQNASAQNLYNCRCGSYCVPVGFTSILPPEKRGKIKVTFND